MVKAISVGAICLLVGVFVCTGVWDSNESESVETAGTAIDVSDHNIADVLEQKKYVLLNFWAPWCEPSKEYDPLLQKIAHDFQSQIIVGTINLDEYQELGIKYKIRKLPTLVLIEDGEVLRKIVGLRPFESIYDFISRGLQPAI